MPDTTAAPPVAFDGACGLATALGRSDEGSPKATRVIDGQTVQFRDGAVKAISYVMTGRIRKKLAEQA